MYLQTQVPIHVNTPHSLQLKFNQMTNTNVNTTIGAALAKDMVKNLSKKNQFQMLWGWLTEMLDCLPIWSAIGLFAK